MAGNRTNRSRSMNKLGDWVAGEDRKMCLQEQGNKPRGKNNITELTNKKNDGICDSYERTTSKPAW